jgi:UDP-N-acetylglucosamine--dolichyl-phosphate N-acetylglucosaminephosphotransferase
MTLGLLAAAVAAAAGILFGMWWVPYQRARGITTRDVHKGIDAVPRSGGLVAVVAATAGYCVASAGVEGAIPVLVASLCAGLLGFIDDIRGVNEYVRVLVPTLVALVVARSAVKAGGALMLTIPLAACFSGTAAWFAVLAIPIMANAFNMLDPVNGFLPAASAIAGCAVAAVAALRGQADAACLLLVHVAASAALYAFNRYPARALNGNAGSYFLGASLSAVAVFYDLVAYMVLAALPFVINGALIVFSSRGVRGREKIERPTLLAGGAVVQNCNSGVISLVRVLVADRPMGEYEIFKSLTALVALSSCLTVALAAALKLAGAAV